MPIEVFLAVLAAAVMHAGWNAVVKGDGDPFVSVTHVSLFSGLIALCCLAFVPAPKPAAWIWLALSAGLHTVYRFMLIGAYRAGDMAQVYPIMRGAAPMMTALGTALFVGNSLCMQTIAVAMKGRAVYAALPTSWPKSLGGGLMSMSAYFIVIWGMTQAPIALVAALRETSVLFGALIAVVILKEPMTPWRVAASAVVLAGVALLRIA